MAETHIAGQPVTIDDRWMRQRCAWCGATLIEYDLHRVAVPEGTDPTPATWPIGALVTRDGPAAWVTGGTGLPDDACARNPLTLSSLTSEADRG